MDAVHAFAAAPGALPSSGNEYPPQQLQQQAGPAAAAATDAEEGGVTLARIQEAQGTIGPLIHLTPVLRCEALDQAMACRESARGPRRLFFKCEAFQKTGSFKVRGALNAVARLPVHVRDVVTHSSGNHAQALAYAARHASQVRRAAGASDGIRAHIVMPRTAPAAKVAAVQGYGGKVYLCEPTVEAREAMAAELVAATGGALVHPSDDYDVIAGQGTVAVEFVEQVLELYGRDAALDALVIPVGGGGLLGGMAIAAKGLTRGRITVIGAEPAVVDDAARSKRTGQLCMHPSPPPRSVADGLLTVLGKRTLPIVLSPSVDAVATVSEAEIARAMLLIYERLKVVIEPSAGVGVAVALGPELNKLIPPSAKNVGVVLCGGNLDLAKLQDIIQLAASAEGGGGGEAQPNPPPGPEQEQGQQGQPEAAAGSNGQHHQ